ncbi:MAG: DUF4982 domain-containing protein [Lachnospiraceae bacterium]|nr:DUF4982 domain-containing protein [Lachnospiraceae bacterium]
MKQLFNDNWFFHKEPLETPMETFFQTADWQAVDIPHDWMIYDSENLYEQAVSCYKKTFSVENPGTDRISLVFEGVYMDNTIFLNGEEIFEWKYGYSQFEVDLTGRLQPGENTLLVRSVYQLPNSRWYPGSGIYRNVWLVRRPSLHFTTDGSYLATKRDEEDWTLYADFEVQNDSGAGAEVSVRHTIYDAKGEQVCSQTADMTLAEGLQVNKQEITFHNPDIWDIESPNLYRIQSELLHTSGQVLDTETQRFGFRTIRFDSDKGFFLNGRNVKINGSCEHHTLGALGAAMNRTALRRQLVALKEMGVNSIRSAHNMPAVELMELCDEIGLLLYSESFDMWEKCKTDYDYGNYFNEWWERDLTSWVRQDRNHPCLLVWGIGNEIQDTHQPRGRELTKTLRDAVKKLDYHGNAVIGIGSNLMEWEGAQNCAAEVDIAGYNYMDHLYDEHHEKYPDWCIFGSETSSTVQSRGIYHFPLSNRILTHEDGQCSTLGNCTTNWGAKDTAHVITAHRDRDYCFGQYIWSGWDYLGEPTPYFTKNSYFGQIDTAGFPKDTYYHYQAEWTDYKTKPMIHLLPYWDFNEGQLIDVRVYSNAPEVELFFQEGSGSGESSSQSQSSEMQSLGRQKIDHLHDMKLAGDWQLPYKKGVLKAVAYDENGAVIATDIQSSFGDPVSLSLIPDKDSLQADGEDLLFVEINTLDKDGIFVANSRSRVQVNVTGAGRLVGLDNGDSTDFEQYKGTCRKLFSGRLLAIIAAKTEPGDIRLEVTSPSLTPATLTIPAKEAPVRSGISCHMENTPSHTPEQAREIPVRKIELTCQGTRHLDEEHREVTVTASVYPVNATCPEIAFKAMTLDGVESNSVTIETTGNTALLKANGDGEFRLCCSCNNGQDHPEVISELEFDVTGLGEATLNPYKMVNGIHHAHCTSEAKLSFQGGVYITATERTRFLFDNVDFGEYGANEIHIPIFSFEDELPIEIWLGDSENGGTCLIQDKYQAKSWYNHYQENVYTLPERIKGLQSISIVVYPTIKMSLQGFYFTKLKKAFGQLTALENNRITGDMFTLSEEAITDIGNNVTLEYENMDFGEKGCQQITICGHSPIELNTIHVRFYSEDGHEINQIVEFAYSEGYQELTFPVEGFAGAGKVNFIFMPGSKFDFKWFQFQ